MFNGVFVEALLFTVGVSWFQGEFGGFSCFLWFLVGFMGFSRGCRTFSWVFVGLMVLRGFGGSVWVSRWFLVFQWRSVRFRGFW